MVKKIGIFFLDHHNLNTWAFKFMVLHLNKIQICFEFEFPDVSKDDLKVKKDYNDSNNSLKKQMLFNKLDKITKKAESKSDYSIGIVGVEIDKDRLWDIQDSSAIITTKDWKKNFSPPSVLEYAVQSIAGVLILMLDKRGKLCQHKSTRGCCLDYRSLKEDAKVGIALGYICNDCERKLLRELKEQMFKCLYSIFSMGWVGEVEEKGTVANDLKKYFRIDLNKDTGFNKTTKEKAIESLSTLAGKILTTLVTVIIGFCLGLIFGTN